MKARSTLVPTVHRLYLPHGDVVELLDEWPSIEDVRVARRDGDVTLRVAARVAGAIHEGRLSAEMFGPDGSVSGLADEYLPELPPAFRRSTMTLGQRVAFAVVAVLGLVGVVALVVLLDLLVGWSA